jgi:type I restriction enzyme S subunit
VQTGDIAKSNGRLRAYSQTLNDAGLAISKLFPKGTLLITIAANIGDVAIAEIDVACPDSLIGINCSKDLDTTFLLYYLQAKKSELSRYAPESAQKNINLTTLINLGIPLPSPPEQRRIAEIFSCWDRAIERSQKIIALEQHLRNELLQKLLAGTVRFKEFGQPARGKNDCPKGWTVGKLSDDIMLISGQHIRAHDYSDQPQGIPYLTGPADFPNNKIVTTKYTEHPKAICKTGDILVTVKGAGAGKSIVADSEYCISRQLMAIRPRKWWPLFVFFKIQSIEQKYSNNSAGLIPGISRDEIFDTSILVAPLPEQRRIAGVLSCWDSSIEKNTFLIENYQKQKNGLIKKVFSGKWS